jgi:hypothetical protein
MALERYLEAIQTELGEILPRHREDHDCKTERIAFPDHNVVHLRHARFDRLALPPGATLSAIEGPASMLAPVG